MLVWVGGWSVCLFVSNKRQNGWTDRAEILCGTYAWLQGRFMDDRIFKNLLLTKFNFENFEIHEILNKIRKNFLFVLQCIYRVNVYKWEYCCEAPLKPSYYKKVMDYFRYFETPTMAVWPSSEPDLYPSMHQNKNSDANFV